MEKGTLQRRAVAMAAALLMSSVAVASAVMPAEVSVQPIVAAVVYA